MRRLSGIVMVAVAALFLALIAKGIFTLPDAERQLNAAVFVEDGAVRPENEGRRVIVRGTLEPVENARDDDLSLTLPSPLAVRYVETFAVRQEGDGWVKDWLPVREYAEDWLRQRPLTGRANLGGFALSDALLRRFSAGRELTAGLLDAGEVAELEGHVTALNHGGVLYFTEAPEACFNSGGTGELYFDCEGLRRVHYRYLELKPGETFAVVGLQRGDQLVEDPDLTVGPVFENVGTKADIVRRNSAYTLLGMALVGVICLLLIFFGVRRIRD